MDAQTLQSLAGLIQGDTLSALTKQIGGSDDSVTSSALEKALPFLLAGISKKSQSSEGKEKLVAALNKDHDGSILSDITGAFQNSTALKGDKILGHILDSDDEAQVEGLDGGQSKKLLSLLAPVVMGALGKANKQGKLDTSSMTGMLQSVASSQVGKMLDQDGDGDFDKQDLISAGFKYLKNKLFGGK